MSAPPGLPRVVEVSLAGTALLALSPLLLAIAVLVLVTSPGGALFRQQRVGRDGQLFTLYKFRSMRAARPGSGAFSPGETARVTPLGAVLRRYKLDELPQLLNVVRGDMAIVGPRPEVPDWVARYTPEQRGVLAVRPGLTGPSQLAFRHEEQQLAAAGDPVRAYAEVILPAKLALDLEYVRTRSASRDLVLVARTIQALFRAA